jgi:hypothetical protein
MIIASGGLLLAQLPSIPAQNQGTPRRIEFNVDPATKKLRPGETAVVQIKVYGEVSGARGVREGRLRHVGWKLNQAKDAGWTSKPFRFQGRDNEGFVEGEGSMLGSIFRGMSSQFTMKDSIVYQAPEKPGKYKLEASIGSVVGEVEFEVDAAAPARTMAEKVNFGPEKPVEDPYRKLAEHYAPFVAQETWFDWKADAVCRSDFDNDQDASNNWDNLNKGSTQAYVYYAAMETSTHWFLIYNFFHARDYSDNCVAGSCHENDNEGAIFAIRKDGTPTGKLETIETLAHNMVYSYANDTAIGKGAHNIEGPIALYQKQRPIVFLEAGGHGALGGGDKKSTFDAARMEWRSNTGITYVYKGVGERPKHGMDREVGYELLPIYHHWWRGARSPAEGGKMFSDFDAYTPLGGRPGMKHPQVAGAFLGVKHAKDKARPFWGWHDMTTKRRKILADGQWGADPAYSLTRNLSFPSSHPVSVDYTFNPWLNVPGPEPAFADVTPDVSVLP